MTQTATDTSFEIHLVGGPDDGIRVFARHPVTYLRVKNPHLRFFDLYRLQKAGHTKLYCYVGTYPDTRINHAFVSIRENWLEKSIYSMSGLLLGLIVGKLLALLR